MRADFTRVRGSARFGAAHTGNTALEHSPPSADRPTMPTTKPQSSPNLEVDDSPETREAIVKVLEEYRSLLYDPLPAAEVNERVVQDKIDALLDRLNRLR